MLRFLRTFSTFAIAATALSIAGSGVANATFITPVTTSTVTPNFSCSGCSNSTPNGGATIWTLAIPQFDTVSGAYLLTGVKITLTTTVTINSRAGVSGSNSTNYDIVVDTNKNYADSLTAATVAANPVTISNSGVGFSGNINTPRTIVTTTTVMETLTNPPTDLSAFLQGSLPGTLKGNVSVRLAKHTGASGGSPSFTSISGTESLFGTVDFTYEVPEPATMGLLGSALIGLAALRKRFAR